MPKLKGKRAIITGASRGIGAAIAKLFAREGAIVGINYYQSEDKAREVLSDVKKHSDGIMLKADVSSYDEVKTMIDEFISRYRGIDVLVCNAGIYIRERFADISVESWRRTMAVNLDGVFYTIKAAHPYMAEGGSIVIMSSQIAFRGTNHGAHYAASKAALLGLTRALALEFAPSIRVNAIAPGYVDTDLLGIKSDDERAWRESLVPMRRIGKPEDVANLCLFLASDESSFITGEVVLINGGQYMG
ncbi:MAG: SDR family NAD(P)-dependent oxidoreductase [Thermoplasmata archaeon]|nr:MAG: SDR family NAD(P)-dependent oxidoreductase [Thermoplasmata archaeon]